MRGEGRHSGGVTQLAGDDRDRGRAGCLLSSLLSLYLSLSLGRYLYFIIFNILSRPRMGTETEARPDFDAQSVDPVKHNRLIFLRLICRTW